MIDRGAISRQRCCRYPCLFLFRSRFRGSKGHHLIAKVGYERLAFEESDNLTRPTYALCRVGAPAARDGEQIAKYLQKTLRSDDQHIAAFKTLLRIGRSDLMANESDAQSQFRSDAYKSWRLTITPSSSINVCADT
jgi:hypothetical protein